jgi:hypothetical protein
MLSLRGGKGKCLFGMGVWGSWADDFDRDYTWIGAKSVDGYRILLGQFAKESVR